MCFTPTRGTHGFNVIRLVDEQAETAALASAGAGLLAQAVAEPKDAPLGLTEKLRRLAKMARRRKALH